MFGPVQVQERIWRRAGRSYHRVFCHQIGVRPRGLSERLRRVASDFGAETAFASAAARIQEHYGFTLGASTVRQATLQAARDAQSLLEDVYQQPYRSLPAHGSEWVVAQADGTMICTVGPGPRKGKRPRQWNEMRLVAAQSLGCAQATYAATFGSVEDAGRRWAHCAKQADWGLNSTIHVVADGAEWISLQAQEAFGSQHQALCDFYHVSHYLAQAGPPCAAHFAQRWLRTQQKRLRRGAFQSVLDTLGTHLEPASTPPEQAPVRQAHRYLHNRRHQLNYPQALRQGLPIGSGLIESGHRHVLQARLKKAGTCWLKDHAHQMAQLRVLRSNGLWHSLWN